MTNSLFNEVRLFGRISKQKVHNETTTFIDVAVKEDYKDKDGNWVNKSVFVPVVCFQNEAKRAAKFQVGDEIMVRGHITIRTEKENDKIVNSSVQVVADDFTFNSRPKKDEQK